MLFGEVVREVERHLLNRDEMRPNAVAWTNRGLRWVGRQRLWQCLLASWTAPTKTDSPNIYTLPDDVTAVSSIQIGKTGAKAGRALPIRKVRSIVASNPDLTAQGDPEKVLLAGRRFVLVPGTKVATSRIILWAFRNHPELKFDRDEILYPNAFHDVVVDAALMQGAEWLWSDPNAVRNHAAKVQAGISDMIQTTDDSDVPEQDAIMVDEGLLGVMSTGNS